MNLQMRKKRGAVRYSEDIQLHLQGLLNIHRFGEIVTTCNKDLVANFFSSIKEISNVVQSSSFRAFKRSGFKAPSPIVRLLVEVSKDQNLWYNWADQV